jgi:signal transduction histidine kinase
MASHDMSKPADPGASRLRSNPLPRYLFAVVCSGIATILALLFGHFFAHGFLSFYLIAVMASAWVGGLKPGLLATVLSVMSMDYFFMAPTLTLSVQSANDVAEIVVFSLVAVAISVLQTAQKKARNDLVALNEQLEDRVRERTAWLSLVYDITGAANESETVDQAFRFVLKRIAADMGWRYARIQMPLQSEPDVWSPAVLHAPSDDPVLFKLQDSSSAIRTRKGQGPAGRVRDTGSLEWIADTSAEPDFVSQGIPAAGLRSAVVFPIVVDRKVVAVVEGFSAERLDRNPQIVKLMSAVAGELGQVVERKQLQEGYSEAVWQQQRRTAQELHDGLGQSLTGLQLFATSLSERLQGTEPAPVARKLSDGIGKVLEQIRGIAKGVFPVDLDSEGLMVALKTLVEDMGAASGVACRFECPDPVLLEDNRVAMHLYRLAQEALTNAIKHGRPREVVVSLRPTQEGIQLRIADDGTGLPPPSERKEGAGLRLMRYRAAAMDAILRIENNGSHGTLVTCLSPRASKG